MSIYIAATDALKDSAEQIKTSLHNQVETAMTQSKATFEQVESKAREAVDHGMNSVNKAAVMLRDNVEAMLASSRSAASGIEAIARDAADFSCKSSDQATAAAREMTTAKSPTALMQLQIDFARTQFVGALTEMSKLPNTMTKLLTEAFEPLQKRATIAAGNMKTVTAPG